jgi:hypothetical protein
MKFVRAELQMDYGMRVLIQNFYRCIVEGERLPIPYEEILRTSRIMEQIFSQLSSSASARSVQGSRELVEEQP